MKLSSTELRKVKFNRPKYFVATYELTEAAITCPGATYGKSYKKHKRQYKHVQWDAHQKPLIPNHLYGFFVFRIQSPPNSLYVGLFTAKELKLIPKLRCVFLNLDTDKSDIGVREKTLKRLRKMVHVE